MIILRQKAFSAEEPEQKEFNSKAAKALNNSYLKKIAAKKGIPVYESNSFRTVERDPKTWKHKTRITIEQGNSKPGEFTTDFNQYISNKSSIASASYKTGGNNPNNGLTLFKKDRKRFVPKDYDHDVYNPMLDAGRKVKGRLGYSPLLKGNK